MISNHFLCKALEKIIQLKQPLINGIFEVPGTWKVTPNFFGAGYGVAKRDDEKNQRFEQATEMVFSWATKPHRIHVWYIYLHLVDLNGKCRYIYTIHGSYGNRNIQKWTVHFPKVACCIQNMSYRTFTPSKIITTWEKIHPQKWRFVTPKS